MNNKLVQARQFVSRRSGATLIELLVVLVIFAILAASAIPMLSPIMSNRQMREGARVVSSVLTGARNRAMQSGRPYAVVLDRVPGLPEACVTLTYAEVPPTYAGDSASSVAAVWGGTITFFGIATFTSSQNSANVQSTDIGWYGTVRVGDLIRFNNQGSYYQLVPNGVATTNGQPQAFYQPPLSATLSPAPPVGTYTIDPATSNWQLAAVAGGSGMNSPPDGFYRYQILRAPVRQRSWRRDTTRIDHRRSEFFWLRFAMSAIEPFIDAAFPVRLFVFIPTTLGLGGPAWSAEQFGLPIWEQQSFRYVVDRNFVCSIRRH